VVPEEKPIWGNGFRKTAAPALARTAAAGIARSGVPDPDGMLRDLLVQAIDVCTTWGDPDPRRGPLGHRPGFAGLAGIRPR